ncbi:hypothetical protein AJ63_03358 [Pseudomonas aeruginosa 3576]|nr:hypothetical protein AJ63_05378 [Pseudomonas aeruginosa 3576]EZO19162.1 hypothetical protein AJ63_03358 [Pseudomonas aeruginosa 3576]
MNVTEVPFAYATFTPLYVAGFVACDAQDTDTPTVQSGVNAAGNVSV